MEARTTQAQHEAFIQRHAQGETLAALAQAYGVSWQCVRFWWQRFRRGEGLVSHYQGKRHGLLMRFSPLVRYVIFRLKLTHPQWGPRRPRYHLEQRPSLSGQALPSVTQIRRYLHQWPRFRRTHKRPPCPGKRPCRPGVCINVGKSTSNWALHSPTAAR